MTIHKDWLGEAGTVTSRRRLKDASLYGVMFPKPKGENVTIKRDAGVRHTVRFIPLVVRQTLTQTEQIARALVAPSLRKTCENIWQWVYDHIRYEKDESGKEQVRSPARLFYDRKGDCDCFTTFIDSVLVNVSRIKKWPMKITNRITKYGGTGFQHIYPIVETPNGERIVLDCVTEYFDYEEPYSEKEDHKVMELEYLNGIDGEDLFGAENKTEYEDAVAELGKLQLFKRRKEKEAEKKEANPSQEKGKGGTAIKKVIHAVNRVNPATLLLRNGLLASMKLNVLNVAGRLKWTYLSAEEAKKKGLDMERWAKAVKVREKLDKIFFGAGGEPENLKKAILAGKGNNGKEVNGLGVIPIYALGESGMSLRDIIGAEIFDRENQHLSGLGEPVTAATLAAASAAVATLAQILKQIGPLKPGADNSENPDASGETVSEDETAPTDDGSGGGNERDASPKFMDDPIGWAKANPGKAVFAGVCIAAVAYGGYKWYQSSQEKKNEGKSSRTKREEVYNVPLSE